MVLVLLIVLPIIELFVMVQVAGVIGALPTVLAVVAMSAAGLWLTKVQGLGSIRRLGEAIEKGEEPVGEVLNGVLILVGGLLMLVPGFVTGVLGLLLLLPPVRALLRPLVLSRASRRFMQSRISTTVSTGFPGVPGASRVYDVDSRVQESDGTRPELGS
jgi:UPF0716 protein FxsA